MGRYAHRLSISGEIPGQLSALTSLQIFTLDSNEVTMSSDLITSEVADVIEWNVDRTTNERAKDLRLMTLAPPADVRVKL